MSNNLSVVQRPCEFLECPLNVNGTCGPAGARRKHRRKLALIKELPWVVRLVHGFRLRRKAMRRFESDMGRLHLRGMLRVARQMMARMR